MSGDSLLRSFEAHRVIGGIVPPTPLGAAHALGARYGLELFTKHENLSPVRSFKVRGALYRLSLLSDAERGAGVVTASTGNHGMAIAYAANRLGTRALVMVPEGAAVNKIERTSALGGDVRRVGSTLTEALAAAREHASQYGCVFIEDGDDPGLMVGAGTIALEVLAELPRAQVILVPVGGGNLIAGIAGCAKQLNPDLEVIGVQSEAAPAVYESWKAGRVVHRTARTRAGGLAADYPGELALGVIRERVDDILLVSENDLQRAIVLALDEIGQVLEGAGAASLAALERYHERWLGKVVVAVLSGGNADSRELRNALEA